MLYEEENKNKPERAKFIAPPPPVTQPITQQPVQVLPKQTEEKVGYIM